MIRAFVSIRPPEEALHRLVAAQAGLPAGRLVAPENLHLTLAFLGEQPEPVLEDLHYALGAIRCPAVWLELGGMALFEQQRAQIVAMEAVAGPALARLREKVSQAARSAGIALERSRWRPHVTLARLNQPPLPEEAARLREFVAARAGSRAGPWPVAEFELTRSWLGRAGAAYEAMAEYALGAPEPASI